MLRIIPVLYCIVLCNNVYTYITHMSLATKNWKPEGKKRKGNSRKKRTKTGKSFPASFLGGNVQKKKAGCDLHIHHAGKKVLPPLYAAGSGFSRGEKYTRSTYVGLGGRLLKNVPGTLSFPALFRLAKKEEEEEASPHLVRGRKGGGKRNIYAN